MILEEVFIRCFLCPGLCISSCPIYSISRDRSTAPNVIARSGYYLITKDDKELGLNLFACTGCGECETNCPINNPLPQAIRLARKNLFESREMKKIRIEKLSTGNKPLYIYRPEKPSNKLINLLKKLDYEVIWIDTNDIYIYYSKGFIDEISPDKPFLSDELELFRDYESYLDSLNTVVDKVNVKIDTYDYILHIPCRLKKYVSQTLSIIRRFIGDPSEIRDGCSGGGLLFKDYYREYAFRVLSRIFGRDDKAIITLCIRARDFMRENGMNAYTIIDVLEGDLE